MFITVVDLEREALDYDVSIQPGELDFTSEITQLTRSPQPATADLPRSTAVRADIVQDIRLRGTYRGRFSVPCARCIDPVEHTLAGEYDLIFRPIGVDAECRAFHRPIGDRNRVL